MKDLPTTKFMLSSFFPVLAFRSFSFHLRSHLISKSIFTRLFEIISTASLKFLNCLKTLSNKLHYYTYHGSLTVPPFPECAIWTVLHRPIPLGMHQVMSLRGTNRSSFNLWNC
uniref:Alpha-carbonic anhydrase domain-containing protein n=1 Tax=Parascaris equorum TaxID=6256 RepID=A0A914RCW3_PAREQ